MKRSTLIKLFLVGAAVIVSAVAYPYLPDPTPVHWNARGEADSFVGKPVGPFLLPLIMVVVAALPLPLPAAVGSAGRRIRLAVLALMAYLHGVVTLFTLGYPLSLPDVVVAGLGVLFIVVGDALGKVRRNALVGLRMPWTLMDDEVWLRSNRVAGRAMVLAGLALVVGGVVGVGLWALVVMVPMTIVPVVHSYVTWKRLHPGGDHSQPTV